MEHGEPWFCPSCGQRSAGHRFCWNCKTPRPSEPAPAMTAATRSQAAPAGSPSWPPPAPAGPPAGWPAPPPGPTWATPAARPSRGRRTVAIGAGVLALVISVLAGLYVLREDSTGELADGYLNGGSGHEFVSAEHGFRATFPGTPGKVTQSIAPDLESNPVTMTIYFSEDDDAAFMIGSYVPPASSPFDLDDAVDAMAAGVGGEVKSSTPVKVQGLDAVEYVVSSFADVYVKGVLIHGSPRAYLLQVVGPDNPPRGYDKFRQSFRITEP